MQYQTSAEMLQVLLDASRDASHGVARLAGRDDAEPLRSFLRQHAQQYRAAAEELRSMLRDEA